MKDIFHYFSDNKNNEALRQVSNKVGVERATIDNDGTSVNQIPNKLKKYRSNVELMIPQKIDNEICNEDYTLDNLNNESQNNCNGPNVNNEFSWKTKCKNNSQFSDIYYRNSCRESEIRFSENITNNDHQSLDINLIKTSEFNNMPYYTKLNKLEKKKKKKNLTETLLKLTNYKDCTNQKFTEAEADNIEKRKKLFISESFKKKIDDENIHKKDDVNLKHSNNLLNYFNKATPEQLEKERIKKATITVKADIHPPLDLSSSSSEKKKFFLLKSKDIDSGTQTNLDEICLIQSETVTLSPKNKKLSPILHNKPKWSLKIQFQTNNKSNLSGLLGNNIYSPRVSFKMQKENVKNKQVPKILLPLKNENNIILNLPSDNHFANKTERKKKLKNQKLLTVTQNLKNHFTFDESKIVSIKKENKSNSQKTLKRKLQDELTPLFKKKNKLNNEEIEARCSFLNSDDCENKNFILSHKFILLKLFILPFPKISHINQLKSYINFLYQPCNLCFKTDKKWKPLFDWTKMKMFLDFKNIKIHMNSYKCEKLDIERALSEIETTFADTQMLWKYISINFDNYKPISKRKQEKNFNKKSILTNNFLKEEFLNCQWIDKYKPKNCIEMVGNEEAASKLKMWLSNWAPPQNSDEDYSSSEEFYAFENSSSSNKNNQVAVLMGPYGSGKTACVYAIAQELGYKVLEVNASSKRPGRKFFKEFKEATESHRLKESNLKDFLSPTFEKVKNSEKIPQNSLIFIEDVDVIFDEDEGFVSAVFQLASNTKRPIVMTLRKPCSHLSKMAPQQLLIYFHPVVGSKVLVLLQLIVLAETGFKIPKNCIEAICKNGDLRNSIIQLQYLISLNKNVSISLAANNPSWLDMPNYIYNPAIKAQKKKTKKQTHKSKNINRILNNLFNSLDNIAIVSSLINIEDPTSYSFDQIFEPSLSIAEKKSFFSRSKDISSEIGFWIYDIINNSVSNYSSKISELEDNKIYNFSNKQKINDLNSVLSQIASNTLDKYVLAVDYLPSIRAICKTEENRYQLNSKRSNRFFHYFQGLKILNETIKLNDILSSTSNIF